MEDNLKEQNWPRKFEDQ